MAWYVNDAGDVVGMGDNAQGNAHPLLVATKGSAAFQVIDLGTLGGEEKAMDFTVIGMAINNQGLVVGHAHTAAGPLHAFAWTRDGGMVDLGTLEPGTSSAAMGVNDRGVIVGWAGASSFWGPDTVAVAWIPKGNGWELTKLADDLNTSAFAINNAGQIIGGYDMYNQPKGLRWEPLPDGKGWRMQTIETPAGFPFFYADASNEAGLGAGWVVPTDGSTFTKSIPAVWKPGDGPGSTGQVTVLATLANPAKGPNYADGMNDVGDIVGLSSDDSGTQQAVAWRIGAEGTVISLGLPGGEGLSVNNWGVVAGYGSATNGQIHAFIVRLRPECQGQLSNGKFQLTITGSAEAHYTIEACSDLRSPWLPIGDVTASDGTVTFTDPSPADVGARFYRAVSAGP